ncbi:hypothetical protein AWB64_02157 [Caballeronia sordidicola]|uniref:HTH cro/C1-type domain-containing protein n=1 Tax=Caballeronia sordidicola TaxID=196367 RepID=A0A158G332_CABSO|nr:hypothetical protein [Caballeronia sordidicola]SAL26287.1 hypothetical protein AWB64_02157 [Caballeronia sordidicola]
MRRANQLETHLERYTHSDRFRKLFSAKLDMTIKRARITTRLVASYVGVKEHEVNFWRAGITLPGSGQCRRLSRLLRVDLAWLCAAPENRAVA